MGPGKASLTMGECGMGANSKARVRLALAVRQSLLSVHEIRTLCPSRITMMQLPVPSKRGEDDNVPSDGKHRRSETTVRATVQPSPISSFSLSSSWGKKWRSPWQTTCSRGIRADCWSLFFPWSRDTWLRTLEVTQLSDLTWSPCLAMSTYGLTFSIWARSLAGGLSWTLIARAV